jgi:host factor-I protein
MITKTEASKLYEKGVDGVQQYINDLEKKYKQEMPKAHAPVAAVASAKELNITTPSIRKLHSLIRENAQVQLKLRTGELVTGRICWIDPECLCLEKSAEENGQMIVWFKAITFVQNL